VSAPEIWARLGARERWRTMARNLNRLSVKFVESKRH